MSGWSPPVVCHACKTPLRRFATGAETPCVECGGELCERCCDRRGALKPMKHVSEINLVGDSVAVRLWRELQAKEGKR